MVVGSRLIAELTAVGMGVAFTTMVNFCNFGKSFGSRGIIIITHSGKTIDFGSKDLEFNVSKIRSVSLSDRPYSTHSLPVMPS